MAHEYEKEEKKQKYLSPCIVASHERILFVLIDPLQWSKGTFASSAFRTTWLADCNQSVARHPYSSPKDLTRFVIDPLLSKDPKNRKFVGAVVASALDIRKITIDESDDRRAFMVVDDAIEYPEGIDFAHAVLGFTPELAAEPKNVKTAAIGNLKSAFLLGGGPKRVENLFLPWPFWMATRAQFALFMHARSIKRNPESDMQNTAVALGDEDTSPR